MEPDGLSSRVSSAAALHAARAARRRSAIVECEARRVARMIGRYGALPERQLFELCKAERWTRGTFSQACELAVERGWVRRLALGFYARPREDGQPASRAAALPAVEQVSRSVRGARGPAARSGRGSRLRRRAGRGVGLIP